MPARAAIRRTAAGEIEVKAGESIAQAIDQVLNNAWNIVTIKDAFARGDLLLSHEGSTGGVFTDTVTDNGKTHTVKLTSVASGEGWLIITEKVRDANGNTAGHKIAILGNHSFMDGDTAVYNAAHHIPVSGLLFVSP